METAETLFPTIVKNALERYEGMKTFKLETEDSIVNITGKGDLFELLLDLIASHRNFFEKE